MKHSFQKRITARICQHHTLLTYHWVVWVSEREKVRRRGGLRIYLEKRWFSDSIGA